MVGIHVVALAHQGHARSLERILRAVPVITVRAHPELAAGLAGARIIQGNSTDVAELLHAARAGTGRVQGRHAARARLLVNLAASGLARQDGNWQAAAAAQRAVPTDPAVLAGLGIAGAEILPVSVHNTLGIAALWTGDLANAEQHLRAAVETRLASPALAQLNAAAHRALLITEQGELNAAEVSALQVVSTASVAGWEHTAQVVGAYLAMARILLDRDDLGGIDDWLSRIADVQAVAPEPHIRLSAALVLAARREAAGDRERSLFGLRATLAELEGWSPPVPLREQRLGYEARLLARAGNLADARNLVEQMQPAATTAGALAAARLLLLLGDLPAAIGTRARVHAAPTPRTRTEAAVLDTLLALATGHQDQALDHLEEALGTAAPLALRRPLLAEADLQPLLPQRIERGTAAPAFALDLLERMPGVAPTVNEAKPALVDPLTERERTILRYLASSLSNNEIASELYVSITTVKTHQRAVYRKLDAKNRRDAVRRARTLRLL
jgi:LuxR family maltose regulon positive regulatory protein